MYFEDKFHFISKEQNCIIIYQIIYGTLLEISSLYLVYII